MSSLCDDVPLPPQHTIIPLCPRDPRLMGAMLGAPATPPTEDEGAALGAPASNMGAELGSPAERVDQPLEDGRLPNL